MKLLYLAVLFCVTVKWVSGQTADVTSTVVTTDCTGTLVCTLTDGGSAAPTVATVMGDTNGKVEFKIGTAVIFRVTGDGASSNVVKDASDNTLTGISAAGADKVLTLTFSTSFKMNAAYAADWTCSTNADTAANQVTAGPAHTVAVSDVTNCASATLTTDSCAQTLTCTLAYDVASVQTGSGDIHFKKGSNTIYQISTTDAVTSDGSAAVTGATATAPVGTSTTDAKKAMVTIGSTGTWDSATIDGSWTCEVESATPNLWYNEISSAVAVTSGCEASISIDACTRTMSCTFLTNVDTLQLDNGIIYFKKAGSTQFQIASGDDAVTSDGSTPVTGVTATAPLGTSTTDAKIARLTFDVTATFDSTLDGDWTCEVDADNAANDLVSISTTLSTTCSGAAMNKIAGILVVLIVAIKALLF